MSPILLSLAIQCKRFLVIGSQGNALCTVVISVVPPSTLQNDITGFTLHSEGTRLGEQQQNNQ